MTKFKRYVLIVERDPAMRAKFLIAFLHSDYYVQVTDNIREAVEMVRHGNSCERPFDIALVDISNDGNLGLVNNLQRESITLPVFAIRDSSDKAFIIDQLSQKRFGFLEHFIDTHWKALQPAKQ